MSYWDTYTQAYNECERENVGFSDTQCATFAQCVQDNIDFDNPVGLCGVNRFGVIECDRSEISQMSEDYQATTQQCYRDLDSPSLDPPPEEVPPYDPYADCMKECQSSKNLCVLL